MTVIKGESDESGRYSVSVVIPVFNRGHTIVSAIESAFAQDYGELEIIVVDDGSSDDLASAIAPFRDRIRLIRHTVNSGAAVARNSGIAAARGHYVAFLDSDDIWKVDKLRRQIAFMRAKDFDASCTNFELVRPGHAASVVASRPYADRIGYHQLIWGCYVSPGSTLVAKRSLLLECGGYDASFRRYEDWDLLLRLTRGDLRDLGFLNLSLASIYVGSMPDPAAAAAGLDKMLERHLECLASEDSSLARQFLSAVEFSRASAYAWQGRYALTILSLAKSLFLWPIKNQAFTMILAPRLWQVIFG